MNKKFTLLAVALMTVGTFTAASAASDVPSKEWTVGNYYYLKTTDDSYLALDGTKADSVIVKKFVSSDVTKAAMLQKLTLIRIWLWEWIVGSFLKMEVQSKVFMMEIRL